MKAVCLEDYGKVIIKDIPMPQLKDGYALVKIKSVTICGSDISAYKKRGVPVKCPLILGHEAVGVIIGISANEPTGLQINDRVILDPYLYCGKCYPCSLGRTNCCESLKVLGVQTDGAMSEYHMHPIDHLIKLPDNIPLDIAPINEPLTIALHAIHRVGLKAGEKVVIIGAGPIGILAAMAAQSAYQAVPILIDVVSKRLEFAREHGVEYTINPMETDVLADLSKITNGRMAECVIEASGANAAIRQTLDYASYCGRIALTGWPTGETSLPTSMITKKELNVYGSRTSAGEFEEAIALIGSGKVDARAILTEVVPFEELPLAIERMALQPDKYLKVGSVLEG